MLPNKTKQFSRTNNMSALSAKAPAYNYLGTAESSDDELDFTVVLGSKDVKTKATKTKAKVELNTRADILANCARITRDHNFICKVCKKAGVSPGSEVDFFKSMGFAMRTLHKECKATKIQAQAPAVVIKAPVVVTKAPDLTEFPVLAPVPPKISEKKAAAMAKLKAEEDMLAIETAREERRAAKAAEEAALEEAEASEIAEIEARTKQLKAARLAKMDASIAKKKAYSEATNPVVFDDSWE